MCGPMAVATPVPICPRKLAWRAEVPGVVQADAGGGVGLQHPKEPWAQLPCSWDAVGRADRQALRGILHAVCLWAAVIALFCRQYDIIKDNDSNNNKEKTKPSSEHSTPERPSGGLLRSKVSAEGWQQGWHMAACLLGLAACTESGSLQEWKHPSLCSHPKD